MEEYPRGLLPPPLRQCGICESVFPAPREGAPRRRDTTRGVSQSKNLSSLLQATAPPADNGEADRRNLGHARRCLRDLRLGALRRAHFLLARIVLRGALFSLDAAFFEVRMSAHSPTSGPSRPPNAPVCNVRLQRETCARMQSLRLGCKGTEFAFCSALIATLTGWTMIIIIIRMILILALTRQLCLAV